MSWVRALLAIATVASSIVSAEPVEYYNYCPNKETSWGNRPEAELRIISLDADDRQFTVNFEVELSDCLPRADVHDGKLSPIDTQSWNGENCIFSGTRSWYITDKYLTSRCLDTIELYLLLCVNDGISDPDRCAAWSYDKTLNYAFDCDKDGYQYCFDLDFNKTPTGPSDPAGPTGPSDPAGPTGPSDPAGPTGPSDPAGPTGPSDPAGPTGPSDPAGPTGPSDPAGPTGPSDPAGPTGPSDPAGPTGPSDPSGPTGPSDPSGPTGPSDPSGPTGPSDPNNGGGTSPSPGGDTSPTPGGDTSPTPGGGTSPTPGGGTSPTPGGDTSPSSSSRTTTPVAPPSVLTQTVVSSIDTVVAVTTNGAITSVLTRVPVTTTVRSTSGGTAAQTSTTATAPAQAPGIRASLQVLFAAVAAIVFV